MTDVLATGILEDAEKIVRGLTEDDTVRMRAIGEHKVAESTRKNYISQWKSFTCWAADRKVSALPAAPEHVAAYLAERSDSKPDGSKPGLKPSTLRMASAARKWAEQPPLSDRKQQLYTLSK